MGHMQQGVQGMAGNPMAGQMSQMGPGGQMQGSQMSMHSSQMPGHMGGE